MEKSSESKKHGSISVQSTVPYGNYIVDFICRKLNLIIEIDGSSYLTKGAEDKIREDFLENQGFTILHFPEMGIVHRIDDVIKDIYHAIKSLEENLKKETL